MNERRVARLAEQIKARVAEIVAHELADPKLGMVTITRVELDRELSRCLLRWSVLGDHKQVANTARALERATRHIRFEVGKMLQTRTVPALEFRHDESIEGAARMQQLLDSLRAEREARGGAEPPADGGPGPD